MKIDDMDFDNAFRSVVATRAGRTFMMGLMQKLGLEESPMVPGDAHGTAYNVGLRDAAIMLRGMFDKDRFVQECYLDMVKELIFVTEPKEDDEDHE